MGRKDDDEDSSELPGDNSQSDINILAKKCKPVNVQLNRVDVSANGMVSVQEQDEKRQTKDDSVQNKVNKTAEGKKDDNDDNSDAMEAETIKKIKDFIAMGRCDVDQKKIVNTPKSTPALKGKHPELEDFKEIVKKDTDFENLTLELELTLNDIQDNENDAGESITDKTKVRTSSGLPKSKDKKDKEVKKEEILTPSRVSKRIQNKAEKFSVKKMLRGDDINVLKRIIPGYNIEEDIDKKRTKLRQDLGKVIFNKGDDEMSESDVSSPIKDNEPSRVEPPARIASPINEESQERSETVEVVPQKLKSSTENKDDIKSLSNSIGKLAVGNGKIMFELKNSQQKKVVKIAVPPQQPKPSPKTSFGPDIIIKRVKPLKKTLNTTAIISEKPNILRETLSLPTSSNKKNEDSEVPSSSTSNVLHISPRIIVEKLSTKSIGDVLMNQRKILKRFKPEKKAVKLINKRRRKKRRKIVKDSSEEFDDYEENEDDSSDQKKKQEEEKENIDSTEVHSDVIKPVSTSSPQPPNTPETIEIVEPPPPPVEKPPIKEEKRGRPRGRPSKAVIQAQAAKTKELEIRKATFLTRNKKETPIEKSSLQTDNQDSSLQLKKKSFDNLFDNFFSTHEKLVEHNDSLDSDSGDEFDDYYAHFSKLNKSKKVSETPVEVEEKLEKEITIYDLMNDLSMELPGWNIHIPSDGKGFCFAQIDIADKVPVMKKVIEMDLEFNTKVYVNGTLQNDYNGVYNTYEDIQQLIYDIDIL